MSSMKKNRFNNGSTPINGGATASAASSSMDETINRMIDIPSTSTAAAASSDMAEFIPSTTWKGSKVGYYFGTSNECGTGYHLDRYQQQQQQSSHETNKKRSIRFGTNETREIPSTTSKRPPAKKQKTGEELLAEAEASLTSSTNTPSRLIDLSPNGIKNASQSLQRTISKNQLKRVQYPDDPSKFMESELVLYDEITGWKSLATDVSFYPLLVSSSSDDEEKSVLQNFMGLLHHENSDVSMSVLNVLVELLDVALVQDANEKERVCMGLLGNAIISGDKTTKDDEKGGGGGLDMIVSNLGRLMINNERSEDTSLPPSEEDVKGVDDILTVMESLMDLDSMGILQEAAEAKISLSIYQSPASCVLRDTNLLSWLLTYVSNKSNGGPLKLHVSEVLASLLQNEEATKLYANNLSSLPPFTSPFDDDDDDEEKTQKKKQKKKKAKKVDGIEHFLQSIAPYRKKDPQTEEECEVLENIFDALAASLFACSTNVEPFLEAQGIELMLRCLREKVHAGSGSLRVLNFVLSGGSSGGSAAIKVEEGDEEGGMKEDDTIVYKRACEQFVDAGGLKVLFPLFMGRGSSIPNPAKCSDGGSALATKAGERLRQQRQNKNATDDDNGGAKKKGLSKRERRALHARKEWLHNVETNSIQIMYALTRHLDENSAHDAKARLLVKFVESDCEKCDRLVELCLKYSEKTRLKEYQYYRSDEAEEAENAGIDVDLAALHAKLKGGGDIFHRVCAVTAFAAVGSRRSHEHIMEQLTVRNSGISVIKESIEEFAGMLEEGNQKSQLQHYLNTI